MTALAKVRAALERRGLLLMTDPELPSVAGLVAGEPIRGSWWSHPAGGAIFSTLEALDDDAAFVKLVGGKVTLVHSRLWAALATVGAAREAWQTDRLRDDAADVLALVDEEGEIAGHDIELSADCRKLSTIITDLERRLLVMATQVHGESGNHVRILQAWPRWQPRLARLADVAAARRQLDDAARALGKAAPARLPWR